jgi:hypothetical protein
MYLSPTINTYELYRLSVRVRWNDGRAATGGGGQESLVDVLQDDLRPADGLAVMDEHGHLLEHGVGLEEKLALVVEALLGVTVGEAFEGECDAP